MNTFTVVIPCDSVRIPCDFVLIVTPNFLAYQASRLRWCDRRASTCTPVVYWSSSRPTRPHRHDPPPGAVAQSQRHSADRSLWPSSPIFARSFSLFHYFGSPRECMVCVRGVGACVRVLGHPLRPTVRSMPARHDSLHVSFRSALRFLVAGVRPGQPDGPWTKSWLFKQPDLPQV